MGRRLGAWGALLALGGCGDLSGLARARGAADFRCPADKVAVSHLGGDTYEAVGCGQRAAYDVECHSTATSYSACEAVPAKPAEAPETHWRPSSAVAAPPTTGAAVVVYRGDLPALLRADGRQIGTLEVEARWTARDERYRPLLQVKAAERGATHIAAFLEYSTRSDPPPRVLYVAIVVPPEGWAALPPELRPASAGSTTR